MKFEFKNICHITRVFLFQLSLYLTYSTQKIGFGLDMTLVWMKFVFQKVIHV